jgi:tetratricopeptide (TPR) repeat protein
MRHEAEALALATEGSGNPRKLRRLADRHGNKAISYLADGRPRDAYAHSQQAIDAVAHLRAVQPHDPEHVVQLAEKLYHHAAILDELGNTVQAVAAARDALALYRDLSGGDLAPADAAQLAGLASIHGPADPNVASPTEIAVMTADVKARLAGLIAKSEGPNGAAEVRRLGREALAMYERLAIRDSRYRIDLERVTGEYDQARRLIGDPA